MTEGLTFAPTIPTRRRNIDIHDMSMNKHIMQQATLGGATLLLAVGTATAQPTVLLDFEECEIGQEFPLWNFYGSAITSRAVVSADPVNADNKVLHITLSDWNTFMVTKLPDEIAGEALTSRYDYLKLDLYRPADDAGGDWKHFDVYCGDDHLYNDDGWPYQGATGEWTHKVYPLAAVSAGSTATALRFGYNSENTDYYIDNITLAGQYDDYAVFPNDTLNFCAATSDYVTYDTPIRIPDGHGLTVFTSRYSYWMSSIVGTGRMDVYCGGERSFLCNAKGAQYPDWTAFTGDVHLYPYQKVVSNAGFYGLVMGHGGKTFNPEEVEASVADGKVNNVFESNRLTLHDGAALACESGTRGFRIGELNMEEGSRIYGYYKASTPQSYFLVGCLGTDAVLAGTIAPPEKSGKPYATQKVGLIKEGAGTYRITGNGNCLSGALRVMEGTVLINNDAAEAEAAKLPGAVGTPADATATGVYVFRNATLGGTGHVAATTDVYGCLEPGDGGTGMLSFADYADGHAVTLRLRPTSVLRMEVADAVRHDVIKVSGNIEYSSICQDFSTSDRTPRIEIVLTDDARLDVGDEFKLLVAAGRTAVDTTAWAFRIQYPKAYTWEVEEQTTDEGFCVVARVTALEYGGQGDVTFDDDDPITPGPGGDDMNDAELFDTSDATALRTYAAALGKYVGVAIPVWSINVDDDTDAHTATAAAQFNLVVAENEMKFDAIEPNQGEFSYYHGDRLVNFAERHGIRVRGHTLAWHSQVPSWLTDDGKKNTHNFSRAELLAILENHITNVVGHYRGRVHEWDVVNECLDDDQSALRNTPSAYTLRPSVWATGVGEDFIDSAFVYAHRADPDARLILNDYGVEFKGRAKTEALYNLAARLKNSGIPIDGVGLQCHITVGELDTTALEANMQRYADLGLQCIITELDIALADPSADDALVRQGREYRAVTRAVTRVAHCPDLLIWGLTDDFSWRGNSPLLYNAAIEPKPAYYGVQAALRTAAATTSIAAATTTPKEIVATTYYNIQGLRLATPGRGLVIVREQHADGSVTTAKRWLR